MLGRWRRVGNYSELNIDKDHTVSFVADSLAAIITRIDLCYHEHEAGFRQPAACNEITLTFSPVFANELVKVCESLGIPYTRMYEQFSQFQDSSSQPNAIFINNYEELSQHLDRNKPNATFVNNMSPSVKLKAMIYTVQVNLDQDRLTKLMKLFDYFNQKIQPHPFSQELIDELYNIYLITDQRAIAKHKHIIPDSYNKHKHQETHSLFSLFSPWPKRKSLSEILACEEANSDKFIASMIEGDNPNETQPFSLSPIIYAVLRQPSIRALEVLLVYNADPFRRSLDAYRQPPYYRQLSYASTTENALKSFSPYELAFAYGQHEKVNLIIGEFSWLSRCYIPCENPRIKLVTQTRSDYTDNSITSFFDFNNQQSINTRLMKIGDLCRKGMEKERKAIFELFKNNFEAIDDVSEHELRRILASEFSGDKYIDIIYDGNRIIGFNLFEIVNPENHKYVTFVHCAYAALAAEYRGFGLMIFLSFRLAYIMQLIHPERHVGLYFSALHYNSYRLVLDFKHYPKFQSEVMDSIIKDLLDTICPSSYRYHHLLTNYIVDSLRVKTSRADDRKLSLNELIYSREILGLDATQRKKVKNRAAPVAFIVGDDNSQFTRNAVRHHGIDFDAHIAEYAKLLQKFLNPNSDADYKSVANFSVFMRESDALFSPKATIADTNRPSKSLTKL